MSKFLIFILYLNVYEHIFLDIELNNSKSYLRYNEIGFKIIRSGHKSIWIFIENTKEYEKSLKRFKFNTYSRCQNFMKWLRGILNYFDIVNNMGKLLSKIYKRLYYRSRRSKLKRIDNIFSYGEERNQAIIDVYALRKSTRTSMKDYLQKKQWLLKREFLQNRDSAKTFNGTFQYLWSLWTTQKGKDAITKENLNPDDAEIHHIKPISKGGTNTLDNLILVSSKTHYLIHYGTHIIYVNGSFNGEEGKPLDDLIHDFFCENPKEMRHKQLAERVSFLKENKGEVDSMSSIIAEIFKDEIAEAKAESEKKKLLENIRNLMETTKWTAKQAMDALKVLANEQSKYLALI